MKEGRLVTLVKSQTNLRATEFLEKHNLTLVNHGEYPFNRYRVWQGSQKIGTRRLIGQVFCVNSIWCFAPTTFGAAKPETWFFGITRTDAIAGYLEEVSGQ